MEDDDESEGEGDSYGSEIDHSSYYDEDGSDEEGSDEEDGGDFFTSKKNQRDIASEDEEQD